LFSLFLNYNKKSNFLKTSKNHKTKSLCDNFEYLYFQIEGANEILLTHIYNINYLKPYRNENVSDYKNKILFREILSESDLEKVKRENKLFQVYKVKLNKGDLLYIPSFHFRQIKSTGEVNANIIYKFKTHSRVLNSMLISLFDNIYLED